MGDYYVDSEGNFYGDWKRADEVLDSLLAEFLDAYDGPGEIVAYASTELGKVEFVVEQDVRCGECGREISVAGPVQAFDSRGRTSGIREGVHTHCDGNNAAGTGYAGGGTGGFWPASDWAYVDVDFILDACLTADRASATETDPEAIIAQAGHDFSPEDRGELEAIVGRITAEAVSNQESAEGIEAEFDSWWSWRDGEEPTYGEDDNFAGALEELDQDRDDLDADELAERESDLRQTAERLVEAEGVLLEYQDENDWYWLDMAQREWAEDFDAARGYLASLQSVV